MDMILSHEYYWGVRWLLGAVLVIAGVAKLQGLVYFRRTLDELSFIIPRRLAPAVSLTLPMGELCLGVFVLTATNAYVWPFIVGAVLLLLSFCVLAAIVMLKGLHVTCSCFGQGDTGRLGTTTILRNLVLVAIALGLWPHTSAPVTPALAEPGLVLLAVLVVLWVYREVARIVARWKRARPQGPDLGESVPPIAAATQSGLIYSLNAAAQRGIFTIFLFVKRDCAICRSIIPQIQASPMISKLTNIDIILLTYGDRDENRAFAQEMSLTTVDLLTLDGDDWKAYNVREVPYLLIVDPYGKLLHKQIIMRAEEIGQMVYSIEQYTGLKTKVIS